jgi:hypothetical protein
MSDRARWTGNILVIALLLIFSGKSDGVVPPSPQPNPSVAPISEPGLHVLIVEETENRLTLPIGQLGILLSNGWRTSFMAKGGQIRALDASNKYPNDLPKWQAAFARPRASLPWAIISNGTTGYEGPLPNSLPEWEALLAKYGG